MIFLGWEYTESTQFNQLFFPQRVLVFSVSIVPLYPPYFLLLRVAFNEQSEALYECQNVLNRQKNNWYIRVVSTNPCSNCEFGAASLRLEALTIWCDILLQVRRSLRQLNASLAGDSITAEASSDFYVMMIFLV